MPDPLRNPYALLGCLVDYLHPVDGGRHREAVLVEFREALQALPSDKEMAKIVMQSGNAALIRIMIELHGVESLTLTPKASPELSMFGALTSES